MGVGVGLNYFRDGSGWDGESDILYTFSTSNLSVTYGDIWGAGSIFPEDYYDSMTSDVTSESQNTLRFDYMSASGWHIAFSQDLDEEGLEGTEVGLEGDLGGYHIQLGYEGDDEEIAVLVSKDLGGSGYQMSGLIDFGNISDNDFEIGFAAYYDLMDNLRVSAGIGYDFQTSEFEYGVLAVYDAGPAKIKAEYTDGDNDDWELELGMFVSYGNTSYLPQSVGQAEYFGNYFRSTY